jgi:predicted O-linked N-acetylglucosamine transferase (SPINDLY family)
MYQLNKFEEAIESFDKAIQYKPDFAEAYYNKGVLLQSAKDDVAATSYFKKAISINPDYAEAYANLGNIWEQAEELDLALESYSKAIDINGNYSLAYFNRGNILQKINKYEEALSDYRKATEIDATLVPAFYNQGNLLREFKRFEEALISYDKAILFSPLAAELHCNKAICLHELKNYQAAIASFDTALALNPNFAEAHYNRGSSLEKLKELGSALESYEKAYELNPEIAFLLGIMQQAKLTLCDWSNLDSTLQIVSSGINLQKPIAHALTTLLFFDNPELHLLSAKTYAQSKFPADPALGEIPKRQAHDRVRIGYFSADLYYHPVSIWLAEQLENHDKTRVELYAFCLKSVQDPMRDRLQAGFDHWIDVQGMSDLEITKLSRELEIDIAIDLNGHTADGRTGIFAARAAPIQLNYMGFPGSMGAEYIDYMLGHAPVEGEDLEELAYDRQFITEKIAYVPSTFTYDRQRQLSDEPLTRAQFGLPEKGFVFTCQNGCQKLTPEVFDAWMAILKAVPGSVLWLLKPNETAMKNLMREAAARGVEAERLVFTAREVVPIEQERARIGRYLASYRLADLFLDTWPYNAGTTAIDALWAGLPVLTKEGRAPVARMAAGALRGIEVPELITRTQQQYQELAIELGRSPDKLRQLKDKVQANRLSTALFDPVGNTRHIESAYLEMYRRYQEGLAPEDFYIDRNYLK